MGRGADGCVSMGDAPEYMVAVKYYRGEVPRDRLVTPFVYRVGVPWLASRLPIKDPMTALNCINFAGLALALFFLHGTMRAIGYGFRAAVAGDVLFVFSFPVFYYGTVGLVDPVWLAVLSAGLFCLYRRYWVGLCVVIAMGALIRETTLVLVVVAMAYLWVSRPSRWVLIMLLVALAYILPTLGIRLAFRDLPHYAWSPSWGYLRQNLRLRALAAMALSFGIPGLMTLVWLIQRMTGPLPAGRRLLQVLRALCCQGFCFSFDTVNGDRGTRPRSLASSPSVCIPMFVGIVCAFGLTAFAFVAAYADGRFLWAVSIFGMPFTLDVLRGGKRPLFPSSRAPS